MEKEKSKNKQYSLKAMQGLMKQNLDGSPIHELKDIEVCESEIESWYEWDTFNPCFVSGFTKDEALKRLSALKALRPKT